MSTTLQCPYEPSHSILASRMQTHLVKCRRSHKESRKLSCPFNTTHIVPEVELEFHMKYECKDRNKLDVFMNREEPDTQLCFPAHDIVATSTENWDDCNEPSYDPKDYYVNHEVLILSQGMTPSERRKFRDAERVRISAIRNGLYRPAEQSLQALKAPVSTSENNVARLPQTTSKAAQEIPSFKERKPASRSQVEEITSAMSTLTTACNSGLKTTCNPTLTTASNPAYKPAVPTEEAVSSKDPRVDDDGFFQPRPTVRGRGRSRVSRR